VTSVYVTPAAREDLRGIGDYVRRESPAAAKKVVRAIRGEMTRLGSLPGIGHLREDLGDETLRVWPVYSYLLIYRADKGPVEIVRIIHGARDLRQLFGMDQ